WTTANEEDFSHFEVERSVDGLGPWLGLDTSDEPLHVVPGMHPMSQTYSFTDHSPLPTAYYRLKMIDLDGTFSYSEVIVLENSSGAAAGAMLVYPNPSTGRFTVDLSGVIRSAEQPDELRLVDMHGRTVWSATADARQPFSVDLPQAVPGVYLLVLATPNSNTFSQRIIIR
ncbi:MAG: T9SS type A sorting domain-containing protein, partial [Bacteroidota bacterium]